MRRLSLNARMMQDDLVSDQIYVVLIEIDHPELPRPIRLSTDNADRIQADPPIYGTRSSWRGANPITDPYLWIVASALLPGDQDDTPAAATIALENLDREMVRLVRSFTAPATVAMAVVLAATPDQVEAEWTDLRIVSADTDAGEVLLSISREQIEMEYFPSGRMTRDRFPGLHL